MFSPMIGPAAQTWESWWCVLCVGLARTEETIGRSQQISSIPRGKEDVWRRKRPGKEREMERKMERKRKKTEKGVFGGRPMGSCKSSGSF